MKKIGVLGCGSIGKRHISNLTQLNCGVRVYDPANDVPISYRDEVIKWADAVVIASPTDEHISDIVHCRRLGKPSFVEKPIGHRKPTTLMTEVQMVGYNLRFHSCVKQAKKWLDSGVLGPECLWANFTCAQMNDRPQYLRDGVILNWSHEIDLALYLLGPARVLNATANGEESIADINLKHSNGCLTHIHLDYVTDPEVRYFRLINEEGGIYVDLVKRSATLYQRNMPMTVYQGQDSFDENYLDEMRAFLMRLDGQPTLGCTAQEGLDVLDICLRAKELAQ